MARSDQGGSLQVVYSTPSAAAVSDFVSKHYHLPNSIECKLLYRGWNDIFEVRTNDDARFIFRISKRRARGDADVASETAFLAYLDEAGIPVAAAIPMRNGSLFTSTFFPEGLRPAVLFRYAEGRPSQARSSTADARVNGVTLARIHDAANGFDASDRGRYRLDRDHLLHRPLSTILAIDDLSDSVGTGLVNLTGRLCVRWQNGTDFPGHAATVIATGITRTLRCMPERDKRCSSISTMAVPDIWPTISRRFSIVVFHSGERITRSGTPSLRAIVRYANYHMWILKRCISSFPSAICGSWESTRAISMNGVDKLCPPIGSQHSWISCCRGKKRSWHQGCSDRSESDERADSLTLGQ